MAATVAGLSEVLRSIYMGPPRIEAVKKTAWTCSKHRKPVLDKFEDVCLAAEALGTECHDLEECPHVVQRKVKDGCPECKTARFADVLDYETVKMDETGFVYGDAVYEAKLFSTLEWEMRQELILLKEMMNRQVYGEKPRLVLTWDGTDGKSA